MKVSKVKKLRLILAGTNLFYVENIRMATLPLAGVRILSLAEQYPGPYAGMLLADMGADVVLVERPGGGDPSRRFPGLFASFNRNKRSVVLDLKSTEGHASFLQLVDTADVVMEGFRPGVMARLKLSAEDLRLRKPDLVFVSISAFGQNGPLAGLAGHDLSIQAAAGLLQVPIGQEAQAPLPMLPLGDIASAMFAALGVVTALFARKSSGQGASIDVSMLDSLVSWMTPFLMPPMNNLATRELPPLDPGYGIFLTADARQITLSIAGEDTMWAALCDILTLPQFADLNEQQRSLRNKEITPLLRDAIAKHPFDSLYQQLDSRSIAFGPVLGLEEVLNDPQMVVRGMSQTLVTSDGVQKYVRQPILMNGQGGLIHCLPPTLGQHNEELLGGANKPVVKPS
jgi:crotonobetainyl-CoA:carnitine CoA-transferase CaiB-like acyl-CoA transferase